MYLYYLAFNFELNCSCLVSIFISFLIFISSTSNYLFLFIWTHFCLCAAATPEFPLWGSIKDHLISSHHTTESTLLEGKGTQYFQQVFPEFYFTVLSPYIQESNIWYIFKKVSKVQINPGPVWITLGTCEDSQKLQLLSSVLKQRNWRKKGNSVMKTSSDCVNWFRGSDTVDPQMWAPVWRL